MHKEKDDDIYGNKDCVVEKKGNFHPLLQIKHAKWWDQEDCDTA